jgi:hypothetical protein
VQNCGRSKKPVYRIGKTVIEMRNISFLQKAYFQRKIFPLACNAWPFPILFAALLIYFFKVMGAFSAAELIFLGYWIVTGLSGYPVVDGSFDPFSLEGFWSTHLDHALLGADHH